METSLHKLNTIVFSIYKSEYSKRLAWFYLIASSYLYILNIQVPSHLVIQQYGEIYMNITFKFIFHV